MRSVGRPPKRGPGRPPLLKRGPGRPPKHPRPSLDLNEMQLEKLCKARVDVYHHRHAAYTPPAVKLEIKEVSGMDYYFILCQEDSELKMEVYREQ